MLGEHLRKIVYQNYYNPQYIYIYYPKSKATKGKLSSPLPYQIFFIHDKHFTQIYSYGFVIVCEKFKKYLINFFYKLLKFCFNLVLIILRTNILVLRI